MSQTLSCERCEKVRQEFEKWIESPYPRVGKEGSSVVAFHVGNSTITLCKTEVRRILREVGLPVQRDHEQVNNA